MEVVQRLFELLDINKFLMYNTTNDEQRKEIENNNKEIMQELEKIKVGDIYEQMQ